MIRTEKLRSKEHRWLERLLEDWTYAPAIRRLAIEFVDIVREGKAEEPEVRIGDAECCGVAELKGFADGMLHDYKGAAPTD